MARLAASMSAAALALAAGPAGAAVQTLNFEGGTLTTSASQPIATYIEDGMRVDWYGNAPVFVDDQNGGDAVQITGGNIIIIQPQAGGTFSLLSFRFLGGGATGFLGFNGATQVAGVGLGGLGSTIVTEGQPGWDNLTYISWCGGCVTADNPNNAIDDLRFELHQAPGVVPEPSAWALMILGFAGMGAALRGRRRTAAA